MRILDVSIPEGFLGLKANRMSNLGEVVLLAGPNGSGKTRILKAIAHFASKALTDAEREQVQLSALHHKQNLTQLDQEVEQLADQHETPALEGRRKSLAQARTSHENQLNGYSTMLEEARAVRLDNASLKPNVVHYNVTNFDVRSWTSMTLQ